MWRLACESQQLVDTDPAIQIGNLLEARELEPLLAFHSLDEIGRGEEVRHCSRVEPGEPPTQQLYLQLALPEIHIVDRGDLQFTAARRTDVLRKVDHAIVVEIQAS